MRPFRSEWYELFLADPLDVVVNLMDLGGDFALAATNGNRIDPLKSDDPLYALQVAFRAREHALFRVDVLGDIPENVKCLYSANNIWVSVLERDGGYLLKVRKSLPDSNELDESFRPSSEQGWKRAWKLHGRGTGAIPSHLTLSIGE